jgi:hypothetical protein
MTMTAWLILVLVMLALVIVVGAVVAFAVMLARRSRAQLAAGVEVLPGMPAGAPPEWAGQHTPEAKMHRRLTGLARTLAAAPLGDAASIERKVGVERRLQELDTRLIALAVVPDAARREAVDALEPEVAAAEAQVVALATEPGLGEGH